MCLKTSWKFPRIAWKPIKVYKVILPYYDHKWSGCFRCFELFDYGNCKSRDRNSLFPKYKKFIEEGFFHSFKDLEDAVFLKNNSINESRIVECTIPRFSLYYKGVLVESCIESYASRKLVVNKESIIEE